MKILDNNQSGFTLVELLVVIVLTLITATIGSSILSSILRTYNKAQIIGEVQQNGNYTLSILENQIRNARSVSPATGLQTSTLTITDQDGKAVTYTITTNGGGIGVINKTSGTPPTTVTISNDNSTSGVNIAADSYFQASTDLPTKVKVSLHLTQATDINRVDYKADTTLQTTVVVRGGYQ